MPMSFKKIFCLTGFSVSLLVCILGFGFAYLFAIFRSEVPDFHSVQDYKPKIVSQVFSADGRLIGEFAKEKRIVYLRRKPLIAYTKWNTPFDKNP